MLQFLCLKRPGNTASSWNSSWTGGSGKPQPQQDLQWLNYNRSPIIITLVFGDDDDDDDDDDDGDDDDDDDDDDD